MTNQEFIDNLSPKAKTILNGQYKRKTNKTIEISVHDKHTRVGLDHPTVYPIEVRYREPFYDMEYSLLHEFFHCIQIEEDFPSTSFLDEKYQQMSIDISTLVLDLDVHDRLLKHGYYTPNYINKTFNEFKYSISLLIDKKNIMFANEIEQRIRVSYKLILLNKEFDNPKEVAHMHNIIKKKLPLVYKTYNIMNTAIQTHGFSTPEEVTNSFKAIIQGLGLEKYIIIVN